MAREERIWFGFLILVALLINLVTLSPLLPWQQWMLWPGETPQQRISIEFEDYQIILPLEGIVVRANELVEFVATSGDVTYGFGVFRPDGTMVFQMQVLPGRENRIAWRFDTPGVYDIRSTEYSGPRHPQMFIEDAILVSS